MTEPSFIFVCGLHRSGTSVLHRAIRGHPDISGIDGTKAPEDEGQHLQSVYLPGGKFGGPGAFAFNPGCHMTEDDDLISEESRRQLLADWGRYLDYEKRYVLEKSPPNIVRSRFLQAMFPGSCFIFLVRHPIPVTLATVKWYRDKGSQEQLFRHWFKAHQVMLEDLPHIRRRLVLRYEDLMASPDRNLKRICDFLDLQPNLPSEQFEDQNTQYFKSWENRNLAAQFAKGLDGDCRTLLRKFGYRLRWPLVLPRLRPARYNANKGVA